MSKKTALLSIGYWFSATTLGMLLHPYKTMREVTRNKGFWPMAKAPMVWMGLLWVGTVVVVMVARKLGEWGDWVYPRWLYSGLEFLFWWVMWFLGLWQIMVGYLFWRFKRVIG